MRLFHVPTPLLPGLVDRQGINLLAKSLDDVCRHSSSETRLNLDQANYYAVGSEDVWIALPGRPARRWNRDHADVGRVRYARVDDVPVRRPKKSTHRASHLALWRGHGSHGWIRAAWKRCS